MSDRKQRYISLSEEEIQFIRDHKEVMTQKEIAAHLGCSQGKICENARIAEIDFPARASVAPHNSKVEMIETDFFNIDQYADWMFGFSKGRVY